MPENSPQGSESRPDSGIRTAASCPGTFPLEGGGYRPSGLQRRRPGQVSCLEMSKKTVQQRGRPEGRLLDHQVILWNFCLSFLSQFPRVSLIFGGFGVYFGCFFTRGAAKGQPQCCMPGARSCKGLIDDVAWATIRAHSSAGKSLNSIRKLLKCSWQSVRHSAQ